MQCPSCRAVYSNGLDACPRCKTPAIASPPGPQDGSVDSAPGEVVAEASAAAPKHEIDGPEEVAVPANSTLIEFPGAAHPPRPQWRKELSERVREIQERRAREAEQAAQRRLEQPALDMPQSQPQLGLVPPPGAPAANPLVAAALRRIERARQPLPPAPRPRMMVSGAAAATAAAVATVAEEQYQNQAELATVPVPRQAQPPPPESAIPAMTVEPVRERPLVVVPATPIPKTGAPTNAAPTIKSDAATSDVKPKRVIVDTEDDITYAQHDVLLTDADPFEELGDERAPLAARLAGGIIDLFVIVFASSPFAAIIELENGNWADPRVAASMGGIMVIIMFLYLTASTALAGRTWGMSLVSLRTVDASTGLAPTTKQSVGRALLYMFSLITFGLGILYALFDVEGRTAYDHLSGTAVVRE